METNKLNSVTVQEMRGQLSDLLSRAAYANEATLVVRQGKAVAVLAPVGDWEHYQELKDKRETDALEEQEKASETTTSDEN